MTDEEVIRRAAEGTGPFATNNSLMALALVSAGVPWFDENRKCDNVYTDARMEELRRKFGIETITEAVKNGHPGNVVYFLQNGPELREAIKAWDEQGKVMAAQDEGRQTKQEFPDIPLSDLVKIFAQLLKNRKPFNNLWRQYPPIARMGGDGEPISTGDGKTVLPGFKMISDNASQATKEAMGV